MLGEATTFFFSYCGRGVDLTLLKSKILSLPLNPARKKSPKVSCQATLAIKTNKLDSWKLQTWVKARIFV
jgi:hypothetical protein